MYGRGVMGTLPHDQPRRHMPRPRLSMRAPEEQQRDVARPVGCGHSQVKASARLAADTTDRVEHSSVVSRTGHCYVPSENRVRCSAYRAPHLGRPDEEWWRHDPLTGYARHGAGASEAAGRHLVLDGLTRHRVHAFTLGTHRFAVDEFRVAKNCPAEEMAGEEVDDDGRADGPYYGQLTPTSLGQREAN